VKNDIFCIFSGKLINSFSAVTGILMLSLPLGAIANNFGEYEKYSIRRKKVIKMLEDNDDVPFGSFRKKIKKII
jgi:hypothetical protein